MSAEKPGVGDLFRWCDRYTKIYYDYFIVKVEEYSQTAWFIRSDGYCDEYSFSTIDDFIYLGKSKANINELFEVKDA